MNHYFEAITNTSGDSLVGYYARVINPTTQAVVALSADNNGTPISTVSGIANMAKTDLDGNVSFYVEPGTYNLEIYAPNATSLLKRILNVAMNSTKGDTGPVGPAGDPGAAGNVAKGRTQLKAVTASTGDVWTLSEGGRSGDFELMPIGYTPPADPAEGVNITTNTGRVFRRIPTGSLHIDWFGAIGDGQRQRYNNAGADITDYTAGTDDTSAILATLAYAGITGGAAIHGADKVYMVKGALLGPGKAQLPVPNINFYEQLIAISLIGAAPQLNAQGGTVFRSTLSNTVGTGAVIGGKNPHATTGAPHDDVTFVNLTVQNITIEMVQNPSISAIDGRYLYNCSAPGSIATVAGGRSHNNQGGVVTFAEPTFPASYGFRPPLNNVSLQTDLSGFLAFGLYKGFEVGELVTFTYAMVSNCKIGVSFVGGQHPAYFGHILSLSTQRPVVYEGGPEGLEIHGYLDTEHDQGAPWVTPYGFDITDPDNRLRGNLNSHNHDASKPFTVNGAKRLNWRGAGGPQTVAFPQGDEIMGPGTVEAYSAPEVPPYLFGSAETTNGAGAILAAFAAVNRAKSTTDKRMGGLYLVTDGSKDSSRALLITSNGAGLEVIQQEWNKAGDHVTKPYSHRTNGGVNGDCFAVIQMNATGDSGWLDFARPWTTAPFGIPSVQFNLGTTNLWIETTTTQFRVRADANITGPVGCAFHSI